MEKFNLARWINIWKLGVVSIKGPQAFAPQLEKMFMFWGKELKPVLKSITKNVRWISKM